MTWKWPIFADFYADNVLVWRFLMKNDQENGILARSKTTFSPSNRPKWVKAVQEIMLAFKMAIFGVFMPSPPGDIFFIFQNSPKKSLAIPLGGRIPKLAPNTPLTGVQTSKCWFIFHYTFFFIRNPVCYGRGLDFGQKLRNFLRNSRPQIT